MAKINSMEEEEIADGDEIYTEDEKELLELLIELTYELKKIVSFKREVRKGRDIHLAYYTKVGHDIDTYAHLRYDYLNSPIVEMNKRWASYHDVTCTKCNFFTSLKPIKEERMSDHYTYFFYQCPKCDTKFHDNMPNNPKDTLAFAKKNYDYITKRGSGGRQNYVRLGIAKEQVAALGASYKALQVADDNYKQERASNLIKDKEFAILIASELQRVKHLKEVLLNGEPTIGED